MCLDLRVRILEEVVVREPDPVQRRVLAEQLGELARIMLRVPRAWLAAVIVAALLSTFEISRSAGSGLSLTFHITTTTAILIALVWLPAVVAVLAGAGTGGRPEAAAGEVASAGALGALQALDPKTKQEVLPPLIAAFERAEVSAPQADQPRVRDLRRTVESELAATPVSAHQAREALARCAEEYETIRATGAPSHARTFELETLLARVRALAVQARLTPEEVSRWSVGFDGAPEGQRIVVLGLLQSLPPQPKCFDLVLSTVGHSRSAFEQYHALRAAEHLLPSLDARQWDRLAEVIERQRGPQGYITPGTERWPLSDRILEALKLA
jgi:hypothetical protein